MVRGDQKIDFIKVIERQAFDISNQKKAVDQKADMKIGIIKERGLGVGLDAIVSN